jgi:hypothetical protein
MTNWAHAACSPIGTAERTLSIVTMSGCGARERQVPLVYFIGTDEGWYEAIQPGYVVGESLRA